MTLEEVVLEKLRVLPESQKQQVLDFVDFLAVKRDKPKKKLIAKRPRLLGKYAHLHISLETSDLLEARKEMWSPFPRDIQL